MNEEMVIIMGVAETLPHTKNFNTIEDAEKFYTQIEF